MEADSIYYLALARFLKTQIWFAARRINYGPSASYLFMVIPLPIRDLQHTIYAVALKSSCTSLSSTALHPYPPTLTTLNIISHLTHAFIGMDELNNEKDLEEFKLVRAKFMSNIPKRLSTKFAKRNTR